LLRVCCLLPACLQYCYLLVCILVLLPLSLGIEGADWSSQFVGWGGCDWAVLVLVASLVCIGSNFCIQVGHMPGKTRERDCRF
jgi:hypothetical protein